jgi:hypothetical protein
MVKPVTLAALVLTVACSGGQLDMNTCAAQYPRGSGDVASPYVIVSVSHTCDEDMGQCQTPLICAVPDQCDPARFVTAEAAICAARAAGLQPGLEPPAIDLTYDLQSRRVAWSINNLLSDSADPSSDGGRIGHSQSFLIDAITAAVLRQQDYESVSLPPMP